MQVKQETYVDKSAWASGIWKSEPDKVQYIEEITGYPALIVRGPSGALCGYVGVPRNHPHYEKHYSEVLVDVHGHLTYASKCDPNGHICHTVDVGEDDDVWWLGFDCAHLGDYRPASYVSDRGTSAYFYKSISYVENEIRELAAQLFAQK
jgi:hypothetical protein